MPYVLALVITLAVEVPIYLAAFHYLRGVGSGHDGRILPGWRGLVAALAVNLATHPALWLVLSARPTWFLMAEAVVCLVEGGLLWLLARRRDLGLLLVTAVVANTASVLAGAAVYGLT